MPTLVLGVVEVAYDNDGKSPPARMTKKGRVHRGDAKRLEREHAGHDKNGGPATTVTVARALEERYGVMSAYVTSAGDAITGALVHSCEGAMEDLFAGGRVEDPFAEAGQEIAAGFREFLLSAEIERMGIEGVPTQASIERRSSRFKKGRSSTPRPSFIDTALYELSMRAWTE